MSQTCMKKFRNFILCGVGLFFIQFSYAQITQDLIDKAKAAGMSESQLQESLSGMKSDQFNQQQQNNIIDPNKSLTNIRTDMMDPEDPDFIENQRMDNMPEEDLKTIVFGREIFSNKNLTFEPDFNAPTPKNYKLSAGDEIQINVWGDSELNLTCTISPDGIIIVPNLGPIALSGLTIEDAEEKIRRELGRIMSTIFTNGQANEANTFVSISLSKIRSIKVNIVGEAVAPGTYTLPSFSTLFNALYAAGGVNDIGTLRNIRLFRNSEEIANLDVYDYLLNGRYTSNIRLEDNDVIIIDPYEQLVTVNGKVKRERIFEVKNGENLKQVIRMAGGFTGDAYTADVRVRRKTGKRLQIATVTEDRFDSFLMHDGDSLIVDSVIPFYENRVSVIGAVWRPGEYELSSSVNSVKSLINVANGLKGDEFSGRAQIERLNPDFTTSVIAVDIRGIVNGISPDIALRAEDVLNIPSLFDLREEYTITVSGAVNNPDTIIPYSYYMTVEDAIMKAGGLSEAAATINVEVARRIKNPTSSYNSNIIVQQFNFTIKEDLSIQSGDTLFTLEPFDEIFVRFSPGYSRQQVVKVNGEVTFAGSYVLSEKNARLSDIITKAGGITPDAYVRGASLKRLISEDEMRRIEALLDLSVNKTGKDSIAVSSIEIKNYSVGIDLEKALSRPKSCHDLVLQDGDELYIPQHQSTVKVSGAVNYPNSMVYTKGMSVRECLSQAGWYNEGARKLPIVVYMNGKASTTKRSIFGKRYPKIEPGCEIIVPAKAMTAGGKMSPVEIMSLASSTTSIAAMVTSIMTTIRNNRN